MNEHNEMRGRYATLGYHFYACNHSVERGDKVDSLISMYALSRSKHTRLFKELGLVSKSGAWSLLKGTTETAYSTIYRYTLPAGVCVTDFIDNKEAIEQSVGSEVDCRYEYKMLILEEYHTSKTV